MSWRFDRAPQKSVVPSPVLEKPRALRMTRHGTSSALRGKCREHFILCWRPQHVPFRELLSLRIARGFDALRGFCEVVGRVPQLNVRSEQEPIGTWLPKGHPHTARIEDSNLSDHPVKLHVAVAADGDRGVGSLENRYETLFRRQAGKDVRIVARRCMTEQHLAQPLNFATERFRPAGDPPLVLGIKLLSRPAHGLSGLLRDFGDLHACPHRKHHTVAIALDELDWKLQVQQQRERLPRHRARKHVASDEDLVDIRLADLFEHGLQRGEVPVNIVDCSDLHGVQVSDALNLLSILALLLHRWLEGGEGDCMKLSTCLILLMTGTLAGCASSGGGPPVAVAEVSEAEAALRSAEEAGAAERAPQLFEEARIALAAARRASGEEARQRLLEARGYAAAAEAQARAERLTSEADRLRREADDLERRADEIRDAAGRPPGS